MSQNLAIQRGEHIDHHYILVSDLAESTWDWNQGEPPEENPAYYLRYNKTFSRMGGDMRYVQADNRDLLLCLLHELGEHVVSAVSLTTERLDQLTAKFSQCRIAVVGDFFLDKYLDIDPALEEPSVETGKTAFQVVGVHHSPGAAGTVVANLAALSAGDLHAIGLTGDDGEGFELRRALEGLGCSTSRLHAAADRFTPTYLKPRDMTGPGLAGEHSRYDTKNRTPTSAKIEARIVDSLRKIVFDVDAVVVMDQVDGENCGVVTNAVRETIARLGQEHQQVVFWADSRRRIRSFRNVIIKPNQFEALGIDHPTPGDRVALDNLLQQSAALYRRTGAPVFVTRGEEGMIVCQEQCAIVPGVRVAGEIDPTGAGDSTTAGCVLALCCRRHGC